MAILTVVYRFPIEIETKWNSLAIFTDAIKIAKLYVKRVSISIGNQP